MRLKSRLLRYALIGLGVSLFVGYFAFSTFLFSPLEKDFAARVAALVPRGVDFYASKVDLRSLFDGFPRLRVMERVEASATWKTFARSPEFADLQRDLQIEQSLAQLEASLSQLPIAVDPLKLFGGEEVSVAGNLPASPGVPPEWAVYGRVNWMGKLGVSLLSYPGLLGLEAQGLSVEEVEPSGVRLSGGTLAQPIFLTRLKDVVIASSSSDLLASAVDLAARGGENSMLQSARYFDHIHQAPMRRPDEKEFELFVDVGKLLTNRGVAGPLPNSASQRFGPAFTGRMFQLPSCKEVVGVMDFRGGVALDLHGEFTSELISTEQNQLYRERGFERAEVLREAASLAPADVALFVYLRGPVGVMLEMALDSIEPALRTNVEDAFRATGRYSSLQHLVSELDASIEDRLALIVRADDERYAFGEGEESPPNDGQPTFSVALVTWVTRPDGLKTLSDAIGNNGEVFGLKGMRPGDGGYYKYQIDGFQTYEFWSEFVPGTGVIATLTTQEHSIISNESKMLPHILQTFVGSERDTSRLSDRSDFKALLDSSLASANALVWVNPRSAAPTLRKQARRFAEDNVQLGVDWRQKRAELEEQRMLQQLFPGKTRQQLSEDEQAELDMSVDPAMQSLSERLREEQVPALMAEKIRQIEYAEAISVGLAMLKLDLSVRVPVDLAPCGAELARRRSSTIRGGSGARDWNRTSTGFTPLDP